MKEIVSSDVQKWLEHISAYESEFDKWESRADKIVKRYRDDERKEGDSSKFNILWSNVQTLKAATYSRIPKPDVSRRFKDNDPVGRVAGIILERALDYEVNKYSSYDSTLRACLLDRFLGGRGTAWVRYEPHFKSEEQQQPQDGLQVSEDVDLPQEELDYECAPCDYVHWRDFGHVVARTWEEVPAVWRKVYLSRDKCIERFGEEIGKSIPLDARPEDQQKQKAGNQSSSESSRALVYEIWNKDKKEAIWLSKSMSKIIDTKPDPLGLEDFWPCPKPIYSTLTNDSLVPVPDFSLYQDQANALDTLANRIDGLIAALRVAGVYDASQTELQRLFAEGTVNQLIPVKNWIGFSEKSGLKGSIDMVDLTPIANALNQAYIAMDQIKQQIYDIFGIADIVRGQSKANETLGAQQIKGQYASLRLKQFQDEVAKFATEILQIQAQIICNQFSKQTIGQISTASGLSQLDQQFIVPAIEMLTEKGPNPVRMYRIEVAADSLIQIDEQQEKEDRGEFLTAIAGFMEKMAPLTQQQPSMLPLVGELLKFTVRAFKAGKTVEGAFDAAMEGAGKQPPSPTEEEMKALDQKKQELDQGMQQISAEQEKLKDLGHGLEKKKNDIDKAMNNLEKRSIELGYEQKTFGLEKDFTKKSGELEQANNEKLLSKDKELAYTSLAKASDTLVNIAEGMKQLSEAHVQLTAGASGQLTEAMQQLAEVVKTQASQKKRVTRISKDKSGSYIAEDV